MLDFRIGDRVTFEPDGRPPMFGIITRYNKKTVTVITDGGQRWNVAPDSPKSSPIKRSQRKATTPKSCNCARIEFE